jgi:hypothetical protein
VELRSQASASQKKTHRFRRRAEAIPDLYGKLIHLWSRIRL